MSELFCEYAACYDLIYRDKDYPAEARFVSRLIERLLRRAPAEVAVLDLACGTGRHALELAALGYRVEGSDRSADMVSVARERAARARVAVPFHTESFQTCGAIGRRYDAVLAMFAAIDYLVHYRDLAKTLANIRGLLQHGGVFIFDFWNGNSVLRDYAPLREKRVADGGREVRRTTRTTLDPVSQVATLEFLFTVTEAGKASQEFREVHPVRYFFPQEMCDLLEANRFEVVHRCPFMKDDAPVTAEDWYLTYAAKPCA